MNVKFLRQGLSHYFVKKVYSPFWVTRNRLGKTQYFDPLKLQQLQLRLLKKIITHSYNTVPFYKNLMDQHNLKPDQIESLGDIKQFPIISKKMVLEAQDSIISNKYPRWTLHQARTGGSTGAPLIVYRNWASIGNEHAFVHRQFDWAGLKSSDRSAYLMSREVTSADNQDGRLFAYDPFMKQLILSTHHLCAETARQYALSMKQYKVSALVGYPSAISFLAKTCLDCGIALDLKAALTTSELLTPAMKQTISQAFNCQVFDFYGSAERTCYIHTCEHGSYHILPEYGLTELMPVDSNDGTYKIIASGFWNYAMPLIRYDTGDIVTMSDRPCLCGRNFPVVKSINGRQGDIIKTPSGRQLGVTLIIQLLYVICGTEQILESQIVQDRLNHLTIKYVPTAEFTQNNLNKFASLVRKHLPSELDFDFQKVGSIDKTEQGKVRPLVSLVS